MAQINIRVDPDLKRAIEEKNVNASDVARKALIAAAGGGGDIAALMQREEEAFGVWANRFTELYQFVNAKLQDREHLIQGEIVRLEALWKRISERMASRDRLMEDIPELKVLKYEDCFDWPKMFGIIGAYPKVLQGKLGIVQIREGILYREVREGNFKNIYEAHDRLRKDLAARADVARKELTEWVGSEEFKREWLMKQEELEMEKQRAIKEGKA